MGRLVVGQFSWPLHRRPHHVIAPFSAHCRYLIPSMCITKVLHDAPFWQLEAVRSAV